MSERVVKIGVHIWVPGAVGFPQGNPAIENNTGFVAARKEQFAAGPEDQILLVADNFFYDTRSNFGLGAEWDSHLIKTHLNSPRPKDMTPRMLRDLILSEFPADKYEFWGTELYLKRGKPDKGCVKRAFDILQLPNSRIDINSCWIGEIPRGQNPLKSLLEGTLSSGWLMP